MSKDAGGILSYSGRTAYGQMAVQIADVNTATTGDFVAEDLSGGTNLWSVSTSGTAIHAKSSMTYDDQGRPLTTTQPGVNGDRTSARVYVLDGDAFAAISFPRKVSTTYYGPGSYVRVNHAGKPESQKLIKYAGGTTTPGTIPGSSDWSAQVDTVYDLSGMRASDSRTYTTSGTYDTSTIGYDAMGRRDRGVDATGTITRTVFDERGMPRSRWVGTNDYNWTATYTTASAGSVSGTSNMVKVEETEYDGGSAGGNGYMTERSQDSTGAWSGGVGDRVTTITYDYRGRAVIQANPVAPHSVTLYDNSNRAIATAQYSSTSGLTVATDPTDSSASTRVALSETAYDERGQVYQSTRWEINTSNGNKGSAQITDNWYDERGRHVKTHGAQITKTAYDRLGRVTDRYTLAFTNDGTTYANALGITTGDLILEQSHSVLDATTGRALAQWTIQRTHDNGTGGTNTSLDSNADSAPDTLTFANLAGNSRWQTTAMWYDDLDRVTDTVAYGTSASAGSSTQFIRAALSCPSSTAITLKTSYAYDTAGRTSTVTDPAGIVSLTEYDFAGRRERTTDNYVSGHAIGAGTNADENRVTEYTYGAGGLVSQVARRMPSSGDDQETDYEYDTVIGESASSIIKCKNILTRVIYPEQVGSQPDTDRDVVYIYNALSQVKETIDPAGNVIETRYDAGGRVYKRLANSIASDFDARITEINTEYNSRGMVSRVYQGDGSTLDDVALGYDGWGNLISSTQDPDSAIGAATGRDEYATTWTYALTSTTGYCRAMTLSSWAQPATGTNTVTYSGLDARVGRPTALVDATSTPLSMYWYMGTSTVVGMELAEPKSGTGTYLYGTGGSSSTYSTYMDPFNRAISNKWTAGPYATSTPAYIDMGMDYDLRGNVTAVTDAVLKDSGTSTPKYAFGELMLIDNLRRLLVREEGELNGGHTAITTRARIENYQRNMAGRITSDKVDLNGNIDGYGDPIVTDGPLAAIDAGEMDDARTYNKRNELISRDYFDKANPSGTRTPVTLVYDPNGNLTDDGEKYEYVYNPWGQLVQINDQSKAPVAIYTYNGLGQRISEQTDTNDSANSGIPDTYVNGYDPVFFIAVDPQGRRIATFRDTDTDPKETFFYHPSGIRGPSGGFPGGVLLRDRNHHLATKPEYWARYAADSTRSERMYYCSDFRGNVVALLTADGKVAEQYRYSASGVPFGLPQGNVKSDGAVDAATTGTTDWTITDYIRVNTYEARADFDLDGDVDSADLAIVTANNGKVTGRGKLSTASTSNRKVSTADEWNVNSLESRVIATCTMAASGGSGGAYSGSPSSTSDGICASCQLGIAIHGGTSGTASMLASASNRRTGGVFLEPPSGDDLLRRIEELVGGGPVRPLPGRQPPRCPNGNCTSSTTTCASQYELTVTGCELCGGNSADWEFILSTARALAVAACAGMNTKSDDCVNGCWCSCNEGQTRRWQLPIIGVPVTGTRGSCSFSITPIAILSTTKCDSGTCQGGLSMANH
ncbi:MAG TPA: hypothetical protein PKE29_18045 [Phycisphaerales bacterium]|nr:hypothetical protein [Phycisphaerales bacterium]